MDSGYLANTVGQPLSLALAEVCIVQPHDPIEWLSGWLHKYVDSAEALREYKKEKWELSTLERQRKEQEGKALRKEEAETGLRISSCNYIASLNEDPFNLWQQAIKAITTFTDCSAVYVAAITEPLWEPKPVKEKKEGDESEEREDESEAPTESEVEDGEEGEETEGPYDSDEEERIEEEEKKAEEAAEAAAIAAAEAEEKAAAKEEADAAAAAAETDAESETEEDDKKKKKKKSKKEKAKEEEEVEEKPEGQAPAEVPLGPDGEPIEPPPPPPPKPPRPVKYKKLIAKYLAGSLSNIFMLNKELNKKMILVALVSLTSPPMRSDLDDVSFSKQIVAVLCADTFKLERIGTGEPFCESEVFFLQEVARAITHAMNEDHLVAIKDIETITPDLVVKIKDQFKEIKKERKKAVEKVAKELKAAQKAASKEKKRLAKEERLEAKKKLQEEKAPRKEARRKEREATREEVSEEEEEEEEEENEEEEEEVEEEEEDLEEEEEGETRDEKSEAGESEATSETEAGMEGGEGEEEEKEEEPEEPESDPEDWGEEPKEEGKEEIDRAANDAETKGEIDVGIELDETGGESEDEETEVEETEGEKSEGEGTKTSEEKSEGDVDKVIDPKLEKKKAQKKHKVEERKKKVAENKKLAREGAKKIKDKEKQLAKLEKNMIKYKATMAELGEKITKLEISLSKGDAIVKHHQLLVSTVMEHMLELKDIEFKRIKCTPHPRRRIFRSLKALLIVLDHKKFVIDDWIGARLLLNDKFINDLKNYDSFKPQDPMKWKLVESYIVGLTGKRLSKEAPFAYLGLKWLLRMKKLTIASAHYLEIKTKYDAQSKAMAAADLAKILGGVDVKVVTEDLKKVKEEEEARLAKVAEEDKKYVEEEARLKAIEDEEAAAKAAADEVATESTEGSETKGDEIEAEEE